MGLAEKVIRPLIPLLFFTQTLFALTFPKPTLTADFNSYLETFRSNRPNNKRPPWIYRFTLSGVVTFPFLTLGANLFYTSEDRFAVERVNQLNLKPAWKWGSVDFGDFTPSWTEYSLAGGQIRGLGINLFPKIFRFSLVGGEIKRARDTLEQSFKRNIYALRVGTTFLSLIILKAKDDEKTLPDTSPLRAQENLVAGIESNFNLFKRLNLYFEADGSIYTRDLKSDTIRSERIPKFLYSIYQPRTSSRVDYTVKFGSKFDLKFFTLDFAFNQVGPGYTSLGAPYIKNDSRKGKLAISTQIIPKTALTCNLERENDNLIGDKLAPTQTTGFGLSLRITPINKLVITTNLNHRQMRKNTQSDTFSVNNFNRTFFFSPSYSYRIKNWQQNSNITFSYQMFKNLIAISKVPSTQNLTFGLNHAFTPQPALTISFSFNRSLSFLPQERKTITSCVVNLNHRWFNNKLNNSLSFSYSPSNTGKSYRLSGKTAYALTKNDVLNFTWTLNLFSTKTESSFTERQVSLSYSRKIF